MSEVWYLHEALVGIKTAEILDENGEGTGEFEPVVFKSSAQCKYVASNEKRLKPNSGWFTPVAFDSELTLEEALEWSLPEQEYVSPF